MINELYPPIIEGTLPAFYGNKLIVPFQMNRAVNFNEIDGFYVKIKTVQNSRLIGTERSTDIDWDNLTVTFDFSINNSIAFNSGQHYKVQIAYTYKGEVGYYSSVGVVKYTTKPEVKIEGLEVKKNNFHKYSYIGLYSQKEKDTTEKLYSYCFNLYDSKYNLVLTSGEKIHNSNEDMNSYESISRFSIDKELKEGEKYYLQYVVTTSNNMKVPSPYYPIMQKNSINPNVQFSIVADSLSDRENGGIIISLIGQYDENNLEIPVTGQFKLLRADEENEFSEWNEILAFNFYDQPPTKKLFNDYTVKQGVKYKYAIVQYNKTGLQSNRIESNTVSSDFEHAYLYDGKRQLKIKYNPKISSFKNTLLESKVDTIGGKHPFIFRNGNVSYKEFPISGMISLEMDEDGLFFGNKEKALEDRTFETVYSLANVLNVKFYQYLNIYKELYIWDEQLGYISLQQYCFDNKLNIREQFNPNETYYLPKDSSNISQDDKTWTKVKVYYDKYYYYPEEFDKLYIYRNNNYILVSDVLEPYDPNEKYYISQKKQINIFNENKYDIYRESNVVAERDFKLEVLDWLNNGEPKLFRSPVEGNYIVRLMNNSLTPTDSLGRLLHTFGSTAYEVADINFNNIKTYGFLKSEDITIKTLSQETIDIHKALLEGKKNLLNYKAVAIKFEGMVPGDRVFINDGVIRNGAPGYWATIGITGTYNIDLDAGVEITAIQFPESIDNVNTGDKIITHQGSLTYAYYMSSFNDFDTIETIEVIDVPIKQIYGPCKDFLSEFNDVKHQLQKVHFIRASYVEQEPGAEAKIYIDGNEIDLAITTPIFYEVSREDMPIIPKIDENSRIYDFIKKENILIGQKGLFIREPDSLNITFTKNVLVEVCYQIAEIEYAVETNNDKVSLLKNYYKIEKALLNRYLWGNMFFTPAKEQIDKQRIKVNQTYDSFIEALSKELKRQGAIKGEIV